MSEWDWDCKALWAFKEGCNALYRYASFNIYIPPLYACVMDLHQESTGTGLLWPPQPRCSHSLEIHDTVMKSCIHKHMYVMLHVLWPPVNHERALEALLLSCNWMTPLTVTAAEEYLASLLACRLTVHSALQAGIHANPQPWAHMWHAAPVFGSRWSCWKVDVIN